MTSRENTLEASFESYQNNGIEYTLERPVAVITVEPAGKASFVLGCIQAYGSIQWKMTHKPRLHVKTAENCNNSHSFLCLATIQSLRMEPPNWNYP